MKALVVRQPWATLIALGIKTIETRPGPPNGPMRPAGVRGLPGCRLEQGERITIVAGKDKADVTQIGWAPWEPLLDPERPGTLRHPLPLGAAVCTVVVAHALPIVPRVGSCIGPAEWDGHRRFFSAPGEGYLTSTGSGAELPRHTDQLPLGDFTPGRWGWMLTDPQPCDPIPVTGRQGLFALPDDGPVCL